MFRCRAPSLEPLATSAKTRFLTCIASRTFLVCCARSPGFHRPLPWLVALAAAGAAAIDSHSEFWIGLEDVLFCIRVRSLR